MPLISFDTPWKNQETSGFLMFSRVSKEISDMKWVNGFILSQILDDRYHRMSLQIRKQKSPCHILRYPFLTVAKLKKTELKTKVLLINSRKLFSSTESRNKDFLPFFLPRFLHFFPKTAIIVRINFHKFRELWPTSWKYCETAIRDNKYLGKIWK